MTTVFAVMKYPATESEEVAGVFSTQENATAYVTRYSSQELRIDEYPLDPWLEEHIRGRNYYLVRMSKDGSTADVLPAIPSHCTGEESPWKWHTNNAHGKFGMFYVWAVDLAHAIEQANERRLMYLAAEDGAK